MNVIPAKAGIHSAKISEKWIPAFSPRDAYGSGINNIRP